MTNTQLVLLTVFSIYALSLITILSIVAITNKDARQTTAKLAMDAIKALSQGNSFLLKVLPTKLQPNKDDNSNDNA